MRANIVLERVCGKGNFCIEKKGLNAGIVSKNLGHKNFYKMNHKWKDDQCVHCGIKRKRHYSKLLMAITDFPPYNHYLREMIWVFSFDGGKWTSNRPDCVRKNDDRVSKHTEQSEGVSGANSC